MILLIEHGQTALDAKGESHGGRDAPLNRTGKQQAVRLGMRLRAAHPKPEVIFHSPKKRAMQTARIAGHVAHIAVAERRELAPLRAGALGAGPETEVARLLTPYFQQPAKTIPGGEAVGPWRAGHTSFMKRLARSGRPVAVVTHSNVIGSLTGGVQGSLRAMADAPQPATPRVWQQSVGSESHQR